MALNYGSFFDNSGCANALALEQVIEEPSFSRKIG
jgi:hypothetical protein